MVVTSLQGLYNLAISVWKDCQTHHKVPKCVFFMCFLANQALHSGVYENSQVTLFFLKSEVRTFPSERRYDDTY